MRYLFVTCGIFLFMSVSLSAQELKLEAITPQNAQRLEQVAALGYGTVRGLSWRDEGQILAINTTGGIYLHNMDTPDAHPQLQGDGRLPIGVPSPDGSIIAIHHFDDSGSRLQFYDGVTGEALGRSIDMFNCAWTPSLTWKHIAHPCEGGTAGMYNIYGDGGGVSYGADNILGWAFSPDENKFFVARDKFSPIDEQQVEIMLVWCHLGCDTPFLAQYPFEERLNQLIVSPDNQYLLAVQTNELQQHGEAVLDLWDIATNRRLLNYESEFMLQAVAIDPDSQTLAAVINDSQPGEVGNLTLMVWNMKDVLNGKTEPAASLNILTEIINPPDTLWSVSSSLEFSPDGKWLAVQNEYNNQLVIWKTTASPEQWEQTAQWELPEHDYTFEPEKKFVFSPESDQLAVLLPDNAIHVFGTEAWDEQVVFSGYDAAATVEVAVSLNGQFLAKPVGCYVELWDLQPIKLHKTIKLCARGEYGTTQGHVYRVAFSANNHLAIGTDSAIHVFRAETLQELERVDRNVYVGPYGHDIIGFTPQNALISANIDNPFGPDSPGKIQIYLPDDNIVSIDDVTNRIIDAIYSPNAELLASVDREDVTVWSNITGEEIFRVEYDGQSPANSVSFSMDSRFLAVGGTKQDRPDEGWLEIYDLQQAGAAMLAVQVDAGGVTATAFNPDGHLIAAAATNGSIHIWNVLTGEALTLVSGSDNRIVDIEIVFDGFVYPITDLEFAGDNLLVSTERDTVRLWGVPSSN